MALILIFDQSLFKPRQLLLPTLVSFLPRELKNLTVQISLHFVTSVKMKALNQRFRSKDFSTDVLTFPLNYNESKKQKLDLIDLGDIFISKVVAQKNHHSLHFLIVHGFLHLIGYDHQNHDWPLWQEKESKILKVLNLRV